MMKEIPPTTLRQEQMEYQTKPEKGLRRIWLILLLGALSAFGPFSIDMYLPSLPTLSKDLASSASAAQLTLSTCLFGLAFGQIIAGPLSDRLGRRRPLLIGMAVVYALSSFLCIIAPSVSVLIALRLIQGCAGAAGIVIARAVVRDLFSGTALVRFFSLLTLVSRIAPIAAPIFGGFLLHFVSWRGVFVVLALIGGVLFLSSALGLPETLAVYQRQKGELRMVLLSFRELLTDRQFLGYALSSGLASAAMFAYISGSSFVVEDIYGLSPQMFSFIFGVNAFGIVLLSQANSWLVDRIVPRKRLLISLSIVAVSGVALLLVVI
jgi:DHA1 family bicyclomycin/chloramphenicol resistance-like MFS transporter